MKNIKIKALIIGLISFFILELFAIDSMAQLNFNSRRLSSDTLRARSTTQGGVNGVLNWPYNHAGTFPSIAVNDTLLHEWVAGQSISTLIDGAGIEIIGDSISLGGGIFQDVDLSILGTKKVTFKDIIGNDFLEIGNTTNNRFLSSLADGIELQCEGAFPFNMFHNGANGSMNINHKGAQSGNLFIRRSGTGFGDLIIENTTSGTSSEFIIRKSNSPGLFRIDDARPIPRGIEYTGNYSLNFSDSSLVDKQYVWSIPDDFTVGNNRTVTFDTLSFSGTGGLVLGNGTDGNVSLSNTSLNGNLSLTNNGTGDNDIFITKSNSTGDLEISNSGGGVLKLESGVTSTGINLDIIDGTFTLDLNAGADGATITDARPATVGLEYNADYSGDFTARSLTDKGYTDSYFTGSLTDGTPTDAEIDAILGAPASVGSGYKAVIKDSDGTGLIYAIFTDGSGWYWNISTLAL